MSMHTAVRTRYSTQSAVRNATSQPPTSTHPLYTSLELMGVAISFGRNEEVYGEGEAAEYLYKIVSGAVRTYKVLRARQGIVES